mmetsp:Transcript_53728/g.139940  ORF Transcript_53728/g.139940 Transcript_53728/m.139940 type:complete len:265 (+) Transcript_53728:1316-2110(+)
MALPARTDQRRVGDDVGGEASPLHLHALLQGLLGHLPVAACADKRVVRDHGRLHALPHHLVEELECPLGLLALVAGADQRGVYCHVGLDGFLPHLREQLQSLLALLRPAEVHDQLDVLLAGGVPSAELRGTVAQHDRSGVSCQRRTAAVLGLRPLGILLRMDLVLGRALGGSRHSDPWQQLAALLRWHLHALLPRPGGPRSRDALPRGCPGRPEKGQGGNEQLDLPAPAKCQGDPRRGHQAELVVQFHPEQSGDESLVARLGGK